MRMRQAEQRLIESLDAMYDAGEAQAIADQVMEHVTGLKGIQRRLHGDEPLPEAVLFRLETISSALLTNRPLQYVLGSAHFFGMTLKVNENVLIPRPETEELVALVLKEVKKEASVMLLDIGTGSGCIALALKKNRPNAKVSAMDISEEALKVAMQNADNQNLDVHFVQGDVLQEEDVKHLAEYDIIVSNPPYITQEEHADLPLNVRAFEPGTALFVTNKDALQFYKAIGTFAQKHLKPDGHLFFEVHQRYGQATKDFLENEGWHCTLYRDLNANNRMLHCRLFPL